MQDLVNVVNESGSPDVWRIAFGGKAAQNGGLLVEGTGRYLTRGGVLKIRTDRVLLSVKITDIIERS